MSADMPAREGDMALEGMLEQRVLQSTTRLAPTQPEQPAGSPEPRIRRAAVIRTEGPSGYVAQRTPAGCDAVESTLKQRSAAGCSQQKRENGLLKACIRQM